MSTLEKAPKCASVKLSTIIAITEKEEWIIQVCMNASRNDHRNWPGYCEQPMTYTDAIFALEKCKTDWVGQEFRCFNVVTQEGANKLRLV